MFVIYRDIPCLLRFLSVFSIIIIWHRWRSPSLPALLTHLFSHQINLLVKNLLLVVVHLLLHVFDNVFHIKALDAFLRDFIPRSRRNIVISHHFTI